MNIRALIAFISVMLLNCSVSLAEESTKIGVIIPLTGNWSQLGDNIRSGIELGIEEINAKGGVNGSRLECQIVDSDEEKSGGKVVSAYRGLRALGIKLFIGPCGAPGFLALEPIAKRDLSVLITPCTPGPFYKNSENFFSTGGDNFYTTKASAELMFKSGYRKVAIFASLQPWESQQAAYFKQIFEALGGSISTQVFPQADQSEFDTEALKVIRSKPDAVFFAIFNQIALAAKAMNRMHYQGPKYIAFTDEAHLVSSQGSLEGGYVHMFAGPPQAFVTKYESRYHRQPGLFADTAYDAVMALAHAINQAQSSDPDKLLPVMRTIYFESSFSEHSQFDADRLLRRPIELQMVTANNLSAVKNDQ